MRGDYIKLVKKILEENRKILKEGTLPPGFSNKDILPANAIMADEKGNIVTKDKMVNEAGLEDATTKDIDPKDLEAIKTTPEGEDLLPHAERSSKLLSHSAFVDESGKTYSDEEMMALMSKRPTILGQNTKMSHSGGESYEFYNNTLPAYKGLYVDEANKKFKIVITCPMAGECKKVCYAMSGRFKFKAPSLRAAQLITYVMNDYEGYRDQLLAEIMAAYYKAKANNKGLVIRWHDAGDIVSAKYLDIMFDVANKTPNILHYAYTKMVNLVKQNMERKPKNFEFTFSLDGIEDALVEAQKDRRAIIVPEELFIDLKGGRSEETKFTDEAINIAKQRIAEKYKLDINTIINYKELMKRPVDMNNKVNVIVYSEEDGDDSAIRPDVANILLFYHGKTLQKSEEQKKERARILRQKKK